MRVTLANVYNDDNRGGCALTWAALDLMRAAFPGADIAVIPIASTPAPAAPFRHTARRYPEVEILIVGLGDLCVASNRGAQVVAETSLRVAREHDATRKRAAAALEDARQVFARLPDALREASKRA